MNVEVAVLGSPSLISLMVSVNVKKHSINYCDVQQKRICACVDLGVGEHEPTAGNEVSSASGHTDGTVAAQTGSSIAARKVSKHVA